MSGPAWIPAVGDLVIVNGLSWLSTSYRVTRVGQGSLGLWSVWLRSRGRWQWEAEATWYRGQWVVLGVGEMRPLSDGSSNVG